MKAGLFFGSFNPIHIGHLIIANHITNFYCDEIWFIVSPQNPLKEKTDLLPAQHRFDLVNAAIEDNSCFKASNIEFSLSTPSYTIHTLKALKEKFPSIEFELILGSDNFLLLDSWKSVEQIKAHYKILIYEREHFPVSDSNFSHRIIKVDGPLMGISSTEIRNLIAKNKSVKYLLPDNVIEIIQKRGFYKK